MVLAIVFCPSFIRIFIDMASTLFLCFRSIVCPLHTYKCTGGSNGWSMHEICVQNGQKIRSETSMGNKNENNTDSNFETIDHLKTQQISMSYRMSPISSLSSLHFVCFMLLLFAHPCPCGLDQEEQKKLFSLRDLKTQPMPGTVSLIISVNFSV
jgi:hypothetical protein